MTRHGVYRRAVAAIGAGTVTALLTTTAGLPAAGADEGPVSLAARASAEGVRVGFAMPDFVVVEKFVDGGGPVAEAMIDSLGNSRSFASLPYPGDLFIGGPPTVAGLLGLPSPPSYPFYASSSYPSTPKSSFGQDGWRLDSRSDEDSAEAKAETGSAGDEAAVLSSRATAATTRDSTTGAVTGMASSEVDGFRIADALSIGRATSRATVARGSDAVERKSTFRVDGLTIGGKAVGLGEQGLTLAGQGAPLPPSDPLLTALASQGIKVTYLAPSEQPDSVTSAGLAITQDVALPSGHVLRTTFTLGRARAEASSQSFEETDDGAAPAPAPVADRRRDPLAALPAVTTRP